MSFRPVDLAADRTGMEDRPVAGRPAGGDAALDGDTRTGAASALTAETIAGPDRRGPIPIDARSVIGRAQSCSLSIDDPTVAAHHVIVDVERRSGRAPTMTVTPIDGSSPVRLDGEPVTESRRSASADGRWRLRVGASEVLVSSGVELGPKGLRPPSPRLRAVVGEPGRRVVERPFIAPEQTAAPAVRAPCSPPPEPVPPATGLVGAVVAAVGSLVVAVASGRPAFALFGLVAAIAAATTWMLARVRASILRRRSAAAWQDALERFAAEVERSSERAASVLRRRRPGVGPILDAAGPDDVSGLWVERIGPGAPVLSAVVGSGAVAWRVAVERDDSSPIERLDPDVARIVESVDRLVRVPVSIDLRPGRCVAITGRHRLALVRSMLVQLAWCVGPADWWLSVETSDERRWTWLAGLPHLVGRPDVDGGARSALDASCASGPAGPVGVPIGVVVVDDVASSDRDPTLRRHLGAGRCVVVLADEAPGHAVADVHVAADGHVTFRGEVIASTVGSVGGPAPIDARMVGLAADVAGGVVERLVGLVDPDAAAAGGVLPSHVDFGEVHRRSDDPVDPVDVESVLEAWRRGGADPSPVATIGRHGGGVEMIDLELDGPHTLVAGTTGSGKSELLRTLVLGLAVRSRPDLLAVIGVDYKGGSAFDAIGGLPHLVAVVTDLDDGLAERALAGLEAELRARARRLRAVGASDLRQFRLAVPDPEPPMPRLIVVVDEFATLAADVPDFLGALVDIARRGRSLGLHLVLATQRPAGVVGDDLRANTSLRLALRTEAAGDSIDVLGVPDAAALPRSIPGRLIRRLDASSTRIVQVASTARCASAEVDVPGSGAVTSVDEVVAASVAAAERLGSRPVSAPWVPPLPDRVDASMLAELVATGTGAMPGARVVRPPSSTGSRSTAPPAIVGVVDDPVHQRRRALLRSVGDGSLEIVAGPGCGATSTLLALGASLAGTTPPDRLGVYVVDARGDGRLDALAPLEHCRGVIRADEAERLRRLFARLAAPPHPNGLVLVDGLDVLRERFRHGDDPDLDLRLRELLLSGRDRGLDVVATGRTTAFPPGRPADETWVGATTEPGAPRALGWAGPPIPAGVPGRFGIVGTGLVAQVVAGAPGLAALPARSDPPGDDLDVRSRAASPIVVLPTEIDLGDVAVPCGAGVSASERVDVVIGRAAADVSPWSVELVVGEHVLVVGRPGGGVTTALDTIAAAWSRRTGRPVLGVGTGRGALDRLRAEVGAGSAAAARPPLLVVIDDAHRLDDDGTLARVIESSAARCIVVAGVRADALRSAYGHWTRMLLAAERGLALAPDGDPPLDVWGLSTPRHRLVEQRPGLGWWVTGGSVAAVQIARASAGRVP